MVTVGSISQLHKTSPSMLGNLHHVGVLDFVVTSPSSLKSKSIDLEVRRVSITIILFPSSHSTSLGKFSKE
jgi:hypothetical protein